MKPDLIGFHLFCVTFASFCYAQNGYQYPRPTNKPSSKPSTEQSQGQNGAFRQTNNGSNKPNQNQSPGLSSMNGYQYNRPPISFTTAGPQLQMVGFPTAQSSYSSYTDSSTASSAFQNKNTYPAADGGYTPSESVTSFSGYSPRTRQNEGSSPATFPTLPGSSGFGTTSRPTGYHGGTGPGTFGSELQGFSANSGPNPESIGPQSSSNAGSADSLSQSTSSTGNADSRIPSSFINSGSAGNLGPISAFAGNTGFGISSSAVSAISSSTLTPGNTDSGSSSNFNTALGGNGSGNDNAGDFSAIPGVPNNDYPIFAQIPQTTFSCATQKYPGYYADVEARCQVFHICANGLKYDFLCPNGTIFSQIHLVCVWWNQFDCSQSESFYYLNENLYKTPSSSQGPSASFSNTFGTQQPESAANNFRPSTETQFVGPQAVGPQAVGSQAFGSQETRPEGSLNSFEPFTGSQMTSTNFGPSFNTQASFNQQSPSLYGPPNHDLQMKPSSSRPQKPSSYMPSALSSQNNQQPSYGNSESSQFSSSNRPSLGTTPPEYSPFSQAITAHPESFQTGVNDPSNTYGSSETSFQNYPLTESSTFPPFSNQGTKPSREYLPPFRKRR